VAKLMAHQLERGPDWIDQQLQQFNQLAGKYLLP
jgi:hypothetical protein